MPPMIEANPNQNTVLCRKLSQTGEFRQVPRRRFLDQDMPA